MPRFLSVGGAVTLPRPSRRGNRAPYVERRAAPLVRSAVLRGSDPTQEGVDRADDLDVDPGPAHDVARDQQGVVGVGDLEHPAATRLQLASDPAVPRGVAGA